MGRVCDDGGGSMQAFAVVSLSWADSLGLGSFALTRFVVSGDEWVSFLE